MIERIECVDHLQYTGHGGPVIADNVVIIVREQNVKEDNDLGCRGITRNSRW